jgi:UDP-N-acetylglucosamine--N-acetylmuramyl-(pentapeptide) pyrophosphoryl-undecaprenol N-acetylglucosamine transferase
VIWQTGKYYFEECKQALNSQLLALNSQLSNIICTDFISQMPDAYALADLVISRAGASSISELCLLGKPSILVPSPNVAEDHQTHNAMALVNKHAAVLVKDVEAREKMVQTALQLIQDEKTLQDLQTNIQTLALSNSAQLIAQEVMKLVD